MPSAIQRPRLETLDSADLTVVSFPDCVNLNEDDSLYVGEQLSRLLERPGLKKLVLDLTGVRYLPSSLLAKIISLYRQLRAADGRLVVGNLSAQLYEVFAVTGLDRLLELQTAEPDADR